MRTNKKQHKTTYEKRQFFDKWYSQVYLRYCFFLFVKERPTHKKDSVVRFRMLRETKEETARDHMKKERGLFTLKNILSKKGPIYSGVAEVQYFLCYKNLHLWKKTYKRHTLTILRAWGAGITLLRRRCSEKKKRQIRRNLKKRRVHTQETYKRDIYKSKETYTHQKRPGKELYTPTKEKREERKPTHKAKRPNEGTHELFRESYTRGTYALLRNSAAVALRYDRKMSKETYTYGKRPT